MGNSLRKIKLVIDETLCITVGFSFCTIFSATYCDDGTEDFLFIYNQVFLLGFCGFLVVVFTGIKFGQ